MKILMIILSGVMLVNSQDMGKERFESITHTKAVEQYKIIPNEVVQQAVAKKVTTSAKKATPTKKKTTKKAKSNTKNTKKKAKKKVVKKKTTKKKTYKQTTRVRYNVGEIQAYAHQLVREYGWSEADYQALVLLWYRESSWNPNAVNKKSGACGVPQSLPCSKMKSEGADYRTNYKTQVRWGCKYIKARYGTPSKAWQHSQRKGWY